MGIARQQKRCFNESIVDFYLVDRYRSTNIFMKCLPVSSVVSSSQVEGIIIGVDMLAKQLMTMHNSMTK